MGVFGKLANALGFGVSKPAPITQPNGGDGVMSFGGFLASNERNPRLTGTQKWITYANAINMAIVATAVRYRCDLLAGTKWSAEPNERGGANADRGVEIVEQGLFKAQMPMPWSVAVRKQSLYKLYGFALHEWLMRRRDDGMMVFAELAHRPQHTIDRWNKPSEQAPWDLVGQSTHNGGRYEIPRGRLWYAVDNTLADGPEGVGLLRHIVALVDHLVTLEGIEGFALETDLRGTPVGRAPFAEIVKEAEAQLGADKNKIAELVTDRTQPVRTFLQNIVKSPENLQYLFLDSSTYQGADPNVITSVQKWAIELLRGDARGLPEIDVVIRRKQLEIARVMGIEFAMVGGGDSAGTYGMHESKASLFATSLQTTLTELAAYATRDLARPLVAANGLDPDTCTPTLVAEPISTDAVEAICRALALMAQAGLQPGDPARNVIRQRLRLPPEPEISPELMGALRSGPPDPEADEEDVDLDDLDEQDNDQQERRAA